MDTFRTTFNIPISEIKINYHSKSIFIGSCFTENIGNYFKDLKFQVICNPTGIIYNSFTISECIQFMLNGKSFSEKDIDYYNDVWFSFHHHSRFSDPDKKKCLENMNSEMTNASEYIKQADFLFLTFGTSFVYRHNKINKIVANCHKFPYDTFLKSLLQPAEIVEEFSKTIDQLKKINPKIKIIFTISPVRHWKDGVTENQISKSILFASIHEILKKFSNCIYFPAYELMMDDLRDYRFYAEDMIHPNSAAIEYIREKFMETFIDKETQLIMSKISKLQLAKNHKPFNPATVSHQKFKENNLKQVLELQKDYPFLDLEEFEKYFR